MEWYLILAVIGVGFVAGLINTVAAGGSLLALPMLIIPLGIPSVNANAINRIAILLQNIIGVRRFQQKNVLNLKIDYKIGIPAVIGSFLGAYIATIITAPAMDTAIGVVMLVMFLVVLIDPNRWVKNRTDQPPMRLWGQYVLFFFIGIYGGFLQAGVGFFLLTGLVLGCGYDLVKANALKVLIILLYTPFALAIFIKGDLLTWKYVLYGLLLASGNMAGAYLGVHVAVKWGAKFLRYMLLAAIFLASIRLLIPQLKLLFS
ncbi:MAG TPA: sulfite exporter TauE/SafE family protein [Bacteroidales bacterium]|nr:sulfite exporter TauE/SafE family protein [Bacteroidales bacterium]